jgi:hypothetical protein
MATGEQQAINEIPTDPEGNTHPRPVAVPEFCQAQQQAWEKALALLEDQQERIGALQKEVREMRRDVKLIRNEQVRHGKLMGRIVADHEVAAETTAD